MLAPDSGILGLDIYTSISLKKKKKREGSTDYFTQQHYSIKIRNELYAYKINGTE